jgi:hypothetical protein
LPSHLPHAGLLLGKFSTLKMEAIHFSETSVHIRTTWCYIPEDGSFITIDVRPSNPIRAYILQSSYCGRPVSGHWKQDRQLTAMIQQTLQVLLLLHSRHYGYVVNSPILQCLPTTCEQRTRSGQFITALLDCYYQSSWKNISARLQSQICHYKNLCDTET